ncbi:ferredoxin--NADP reductase [Adhaeribacter pallidiroseus]|uniref:1,2-phenylacetyl-CoA epoxidase, subunit n=1 Tax=Adhaeribacter pallidiroseus TaxID=2072847 RepID=A0A369QSJ2_9BACT|nr:ferredoxin--NADP reductase [Adhaeribacter pallidiroseus]RDC65789.1 1,2-phenylacetyl-CoA epoxidase, subunit [Adhaeribacter pallidiroseus]
MDSLYKILTISEIREVAPTVKTFSFSENAENKISYQAGQYLTLVRQTAVGEVRRSYSITSSPELQEPLTIGVKRIPNGIFSRQLVDYAQVGDQVYTTGAAGLFTLPLVTTSYQHVLFCAAGSGITPVYSLLKTILHAHPHLSVTLLYSNHSSADTIFKKNLDLLAQQFSERLQIEFLFSNNTYLSRARLHKTLLHTFMQQHVAAPPVQVLCYICGPINYMRMCTYALREAHIPAVNIRKENFSTDKPIIRHEPPDTEAHAVYINYGQQEYRLQVQYPKTILQTAKEAGLLLPYSCEAGRCGNCVARCTQGKVWLSYNEVLTDKDLANGLILTCVGYPVRGDVHLSI